MDCQQGCGPDVVPTLIEGPKEATTRSTSPFDIIQAQDQHQPASHSSMGPPVDAPDEPSPGWVPRRTSESNSGQSTGRAADPMDASLSADNKRKRLVGSSSGQDLLAVQQAPTVVQVTSINTRMDITSLNKGAGKGPGLAGLANLGNTCFMNSSLQCLAHTVPLMRAFLTGDYLQDINTTNPLGMKGELAEGFGQLMHLLWKGGIGHVTPRKFKERIGRFAPQFSGYAQHDSQEFIAFLLDGLHEDLNRIKNKPYIEEKDNTGRPDAELAADAWANYRARNDSTIVDHFQGLYKSQLDCPQCQFRSVKFDPFMYLSLPLPESRMRHLTITVVCIASSEAPAKVVVEVPNAGTVRDVQSKVWQLLGPTLSSPTTWGKSGEPPHNPAGSPTASPAAEPVATAGLQAAAAAPGAAAGPSDAGAVAGAAAPTGLPPPPPMLCVRLNRGYSSMSDDLELFPPTARVSEIVPSSKFVSGEFLVMYLYPQVPVQGDAPQTLDDLPVLGGLVGAAAQQQQQGAGGLEPLAGIATVAAAAGVARGDGSGGSGEAAAVPDAGSDMMQAEGAADGAADGELQGGGIVEQPAEMQRVFGVPFAPGCSPLVIHHRLMPRTTYGRGRFFMVPLILWVPTHLLPTSLEHPDVQEVPAAAHHTFLREYEIIGASAALCSRAVHAALRTYRTLEGIIADEAELTASGHLRQDVYDLPDLPEEQEDDTAAAAAGAVRSTAAVAGSAAPSGLDMNGSPSLGADTAMVPANGFSTEAGEVMGTAVDGEVQPLVTPHGTGFSSGGISSGGQLLGGDVQQVQGGSPGGDSTMMVVTEGAAGTLDAPEMVGGVVGTMEEVAQAMAASSQPSRRVTAPAVIGAGGSVGEGAEYGLGTQSMGTCSTWATPAPGDANAPSPFVTHSTEPFDMFAAQETTLQGVLSGGGGTSGKITGAGYRLLVSTSHGQHQIASKAKPFQQAKTDGMWHVLCEWASDAGGRWDIVSMDCPPLDHPSLLAHDRRKAAGKAPVALDACVEAFLQPEQLSEEDSWYCPRCKEHVQADKKLDLWALPEVLVVHLKRFSYTRYSRDKLDTPVDAPHELDLSRYILHLHHPTTTTTITTTTADGTAASNHNTSDNHNTAIPVTTNTNWCHPTSGDVTSNGQPAAGPSAAHHYQLFGVVNHFGGLGGGHYTAHVKMPSTDEWHVYDDSSVHPIDAARVVTPAAYLLLYRASAACQQDPEDLLDQLLVQHQEHLKREESRQSPASDDALPNTDQDLPFTNTCTDLQLYSPATPHTTATPQAAAHGLADMPVVPGYAPPAIEYVVDDGYPLPDPGLGQHRRSLDGGEVPAAGDGTTPDLLAGAAWALHNHQQDAMHTSSPSSPTTADAPKPRRHFTDYQPNWQLGSSMAGSSGAGIDAGGASGWGAGGQGDAGWGGVGLGRGQADPGHSMSDLYDMGGPPGAPGSDAWSQQTDGDSLEAQQSDLDPEELHSVGRRSPSVDGGDLNDMWDTPPPSYPASVPTGDLLGRLGRAGSSNAAGGDAQGCNGMMPGLVGAGSSGLVGAGSSGLDSGQELTAAHGAQPMMLSPVKHVPGAAGQHVLSTSATAASGGSHMVCEGGNV